jgi:hypothetical protein
MVILLITSVLLLSLIAVAIYLWQKPSAPAETIELPGPEARSLFDDASPLLTAPAGNDTDEQRSTLLLQAAAGNRESLLQANRIHRQLYETVLHSLLQQCKDSSQLLSLLSYVTRHELPVTKPLATAFIRACQDSPNRATTSKMIHIAALSDDAETYNRAVELTMNCWRDGKLSDVSTLDLQVLLSGEFWVLSSSTRSSGAGFLLKRTLASAQRELSNSATD